MHAHMHLSRRACYCPGIQGHSLVTCGELSLHTRTAIQVAEMLTAAKFAVRQLPSGVWEIACEGAGIKAGPLVAA